ncbi:MFS transporter [Spirosoma utsteinense]|uniref:UMF1 family MFS transporter n=1 Tax=Spirosoma utsteinense TaxID=2585773 RepID=A0ABR6WAZ5_9BACT|nr:MFS transporter [Spirosoma utsteinense]MBC3785690.1 UMF1 family MFS transporter [Spirosoma utsteinense]MBC3793732.1 UMF1 family MFS transporter [Spirosoma utsteinense]
MKNNPRTLTAWTFYDWANSVHSLVIVSSIFPVYFSATALNEAGGPIINFLGFPIKNTVLFSYTVSAAFLLTALLSPVCSAIADYSGRKKAFMKAFCYLGAICCGLLYFFTRDTTTFAVICFGLSLVGWSGSIVFYNSYLPDIATDDQFDRVSARGFSMGYIGSVLLMIFNLLMILKRDWFGNISEGTASRIAFLTVGVWWIGFAQIAFSRLPDGTRKPGQNKNGRYLLNGFRELRSVLNQLSQRPLILKFLTAFFVYNMGVQTVMYVATIFGSDELKMDGQNLIILVLLLQLVAIPGAYGFSWLSARIGNTYALMVAVVIWIGICAGAYLVQTQGQFFALASVVGLVMGGIQSLSRSTYSKLIPATTDTASYFSFYDVTEKLSIVMGTLLYGLIEQLTGSMRNSVLGLLVLFIIGLLLLWRIPSQKIYRVHLETKEVS